MDNQKTQYFLVNKNNNLIGGHDYGSRVSAEENMKTSNIPIEDVQVIEFQMKFLNCYVNPKQYQN
jgi:hypothetical protein